MLQLIKIFWGLCRFSHGPQDVPYSQNILLAVMVLTTSLSVLSAMRVQPLANAIWLTLMALFITLAIIYVGLRLRKCQARFVQTSSAYFGASIIVSLITAVSMIFVVSLASAGGQSAVQTVAAIMLVLGFIWTIAVCSHIFRQALQIPWVAAILFTIILELSKAIIIRAALGGMGS